LFDDHPLIDNGPRELPIAHDGKQLAVSDSAYYLMLDVEKMKVAWKRLIDANDMSRLPPMRFELNGDYFAVVKQDYDAKTIHMLSARTGDILWRTDPKVPTSPQPIYSMVIRDGKLYGIRPHAGQGFYFVGWTAKRERPCSLRTSRPGTEESPRSGSGLTSMEMRSLRDPGSTGLRAEGAGYRSRQTHTPAEGAIRRQLRRAWPGLGNRAQRNARAAGEE